METPLSPNPLIDGADPLTGLTWSQYSGDVYVASLATMPLKLYVDPTGSVGLCEYHERWPQLGRLLSAGYAAELPANGLHGDANLQLGDTGLWSATNHWEMYVWPYTTLPSVGQTYANTGQFYKVSILEARGRGRSGGRIPRTPGRRTWRFTGAARSS